MFDAAELLVVSIVREMTGSLPAPFHEKREAHNDRRKTND